MVVYVDVLFIINLLIDYIALLVSAKICAVPTPRLRLLAAAAFGALFAVVTVLPFGAVLANPLIKIGAGAVMVLMAFVGKPRLLRLTLVFFAVSAAFGGVVMAATYLGGGRLSGVVTAVDMRLLAIAFGLSYVALTLIFRRAARHRPSEIVPVTLRHGGREVSLKALRDTGNALTDPMSGRPVVVAGVGDIKTLFPQSVLGKISELRAKDAVRVLEELSHLDNTIRFQLIPYRAVGIAGGMLLAFKPDEIVIDGKSKTGMLLALSPNSVSDGGPYSALLGT
jgi:stage II sporulation protein GA (sporulation sigma-E factor processing peptidase)